MFDTAITADTVLSEVETLAEAKEIARSLRQTMMVVEAKYGMGHSTTKIYADRYFDFVDAMAEKFA